jgi:co-chaperonin GroES (HSP10)
MYVPRDSVINSSALSIVGFGINHDEKNCDFKIGDVVICEQDTFNNVQMGIGGIDFVLRKIDKIAAIVGHEDDIESLANFGRDVPVIHDISEMKCAEGVGDKIVIKRNILRGFYKAGSLYVPYERRELGRAHNGTVIGISEETSKKTGISKGMQVIYDYNASFGHNFDFDIVKEENVFAILSKEDEHQIMEE